MRIQAGRRHARREKGKAMTCSRCGHRHANPACHVCQDDAELERAKRDHDDEEADKARKEEDRNNDPSGYPEKVGR